MLNKKKSILITNYHQDLSGGGGYVMMILNLLKDYLDIYVEENLEYYLSNLTPFNLSPWDIKVAPKNFKPDIHFFSGYRGWVEPRAELSIQLCYFPVEKKIDGWKYFIVPNDFVRRNLISLWGRDAFIIPPYFNKDNFLISPKENTCISIGNYFLEKDGHSKNQHLIIKWFRENAKKLNLNKLILHGYKNNPDYYSQLETLAKGDVRIDLKHNTSQTELRADLAKSKYLLHAIGYGRNTSLVKILQRFNLKLDRLEQVEHFGFVAVESMLSGALPIVHNSGGCPEIEGVSIYNTFEELTNLIMVNPNPDTCSLRKFGEAHTYEASKAATLAMLNSIIDLSD